MNVLPLVFTFLLLFSCLSLTFFREVKSYFLVESTLEGYHRTERVVNNAIVQKSYRKIKGEALVKKGQARATTQKNYVCRRTLFPPLDNAKLNMGALIKEQTEYRLHPLYEPLAALLRLLYQNCLFSKEPNAEKLSYRLMDAMLKKADKLKEVEDISELYPEDPKLKALYYKMLKGTNRYSRTEGIPPLTDFLCIDKDRKAASLSFASPLLLEALFNAEIAAEILKEERKKWEDTNKYYFFSKEDLHQLLMKNPSQAAKMTTLESLLDYSKAWMARDQIGGRDKKTGIGVAKSL